MSEQEKKRKRIYDLLNAKTKLKFLCLPYTKQRKKINRKRVFKEKDDWTKTERRFLSALATVIKEACHNVNKKARLMN